MMIIMINIEIITLLMIMNMIMMIIMINLTLSTTYQQIHGVGFFLGDFSFYKISSIYRDFRRRICGISLRFL